MRVQIHDSLKETFVPLSLPVGKNPVYIGGARENDVVLNTGLITDTGAVIFNEGDDEGWKFRALCEGWKKDEQHLLRDQSVLLAERATIQFHHFTLEITLELMEQAQSDDVLFRQLDQRCSDIISELHLSLTKQLRSTGDETAGENEHISDDRILRVEELIAALADEHPQLPDRSGNRNQLSDNFSFAHFRSRLLQRLVSRFDDEDSVAAERTGTPWSRLRSTDREREKQIENILQIAERQLQLPEHGDLSGVIRKLEKRARSVWADMLDSAPADTLRYMYLAQLRKEIKDIIFGLGPLEDLLDDPSVKEIMVNDADHIYIEKGNSIENSGRRFVKDVMDIAQRIVSGVHREVNTSEPMVDARLPDGSRVNAIIKPLTIGGPCLTIRRFPQHRITIDRLVESGSLSAAAREFLSAAVRHRCNILVSGGTGTGKTTLLNALSEFIPDKERIITIEDTAELKLISRRTDNQIVSKVHVVSLEAKKANLQGKGAVDIRMLVRNALRMRPDRIIVGECRGGEALDMLQAMNTGHDGSMTTIHANSPEDVVSRLEVMVQQNSDSVLPVESIHQQISSALDLIIQLSGESVPNPDRPGDFERQRVVSMISEVTEIDPMTQELHVKPLFDRQRGGELKPTGFLPNFILDLVNVQGLDLDLLLPASVGVGS